MYPNQTGLIENFSIFHLTLHHQVDYARFEEFYQRLRQHGWQLHDYLQPHKNCQRDFAPQAVFLPHTHESLFGKIRQEPNSHIEPQSAIIKERLNPNSHQSPYPENLLLSKVTDAAAGIGCQLALPENERTRFIFTIAWVDLWLFNDCSAILAFKTKLLKIKRDNVFQSPCLDDLNRFNRRLRYPGGSLGNPPDLLDYVDSPASPIHLWAGLIHAKWLGFANKNVLMLEQLELDDYSRYSKLFTVAQIPNIKPGKDEFQWNRPVMHPDLTSGADYNQMVEGEWSAAYEVYQRALLAGAVNVRDMLLFELATTSGEGKSWAGERQWQYDLTYVNRLFAENSIKIWGYWQGLALRDVCGFLSYDDSMPLMQQAESRYYPLYIYTYHQHIRLNHFSQEIIDYELGDCVKARQILEAFHAFHNQYWFSEVTVDHQGIEIVAKMKQGLGIERKYIIVNNEIKEISTFIERKMQAGRQTFLAFLILAFYPFQYFGVGELVQNFIGSSVWQIVGFNVVAILTVVGIFWWILPRRLGFLCRLFNRFYHRSLE